MYYLLKPFFYEDLLKPLSFLENRKGAEVWVWMFGSMYDFFSSTNTMIRTSPVCSRKKKPLSFSKFHKIGIANQV